MGFFRGTLVKKFSKDKKRSLADRASAAVASWPKAAILNVLREQYGDIELLEEKDNLAFYGVYDNDLRFAAVLVRSPADPNEIIEVGFVARFGGFDVTDEKIEFINSNVHIGVCGQDEQGNLILIAGVVATGPFNPAAFSMLLKAWSRDVLLALYALSDRGPVTAGFAAGQSQAARDFALNNAPGYSGKRALEDGAPREPISFQELTQHFLGRKQMLPCDGCNGRGKRGLIVKTCHDCDGSGFIEAPRQAFGA